MNTVSVAGRRARSIDEFRQVMSRFISRQGYEHALRFEPRPSDVVIATYPKAGTTWMQQIVHGLRTRGDMDFEEITAVTPWIELAFDVGWNLEAEQRGEPRAFKSHWDGDQAPEGCRRICVLRDPRDTVVSFYHFMDGWFLERGSVSLDEFARHLVTRDHHAGSYWTHLLSWWRRRDEPGVCITTFEDLKQDLEREVRRVARFIGLERDEAAIEIAARQARFEFMKAHESHFDDHLIAEARNEACGLPKDARSTKVRSGLVGDHEALSAETTKQLAEIWGDLVTKETGHPDYASLRDALHASRA